MCACTRRPEPAVADLKTVLTQSWKEMHDACTVRHAEALRMAEDRVALAEQRVLDYDER